METRANFILIGAFTLAAILGTLGFFIWLASVQLDRQYASYGILFDDVTGLDASGAVTYNGIAVGSVINLRIYENDPSKVFTTIQIDAATPVTSNTVAQLQSQGVTGVAYISLSTGEEAAEPLSNFSNGLPIIPSRRSTVQALVEDAPDILAEAKQLLQQAQVITGPENQALVNDILSNLARTSGQLDQALSDFSDISGTVRDATAQITLFTDRLESIGEGVDTTLRSTDSALVAVQQAFISADAVLNTMVPALERFEGTFALAEILMRDQIPAVLTQIAIGLGDISTRASDTLDGFGETASLLNARLVELETTLADASEAFDAVTTASESFSEMIEGDGTAFIAEARAAIATVETVVNTDLPLIVADVRRAVNTAAVAVEDVAADVTGFTSRLEPMASDAQQTITAATDLIAQAHTSLAALNTTLVVVDGALGSAQDTFDSANDVLQSDIGPVLADLRTAAGRISVAVEDVTADVPAIAADLRALIARADEVVVQVQAAVAQSSPGISAFTTTGLPELTRFGSEARSLVSTLNTLARRIESNPTGFILDNRVPEYRR
ncbi:MlaD family protein [Yoonia sp.]|uniref:MlaD family protein n=1 Tax=Yoonia sp. TaxID=2212373 RepID=UPI00391C4DDC